MVLAAAEEGTMQTSAEIAKQLAESAVMVRRCFLLLHKRGLIEQRKGPNGGAKLKLAAKQIGLGDIYSASEGEWLVHDEPAIAGLLKRVREDGVQAMQFLRRQAPYDKAPRPDLIMLDLNLPRKDGREVLAEIKGDGDLKTIPIVVLTTSRADQDILRSYQLNANCYINKPVDFNQFLEVVRSIESFWLFVVTLPPAPPAGGG